MGVFLVCSAVLFRCFCFRSERRVSQLGLQLLSSSELPASIICAVILSEAVSWVQWVGIALIFFGIAYPYLGAGDATGTPSVVSGK
ncbi:MAG: hypothetical protein MJ014_04725 [Methanocorpusculum sp.]|nr:hypothetical protein [Methanocorpusculum sp.]